MRNTLSNHNSYNILYILYTHASSPVSWRKARFRGLRGFRCFPKRPVQKSLKFQSAAAAVGRETHV